MSSLDLTRFKQLGDELWDGFIKTSLRTFDTIEDMLRDNGVKDGMLQAVLSIPKVVRQEDIDTVGAEWFPYNDLRRYRKYRDFPLTFSRTGLDYGTPLDCVDLEVIVCNKIVYHIFEYQKKILILRPEEIFTDSGVLSLMLEALGEANDGRYNVLEVIGMYHLLALKATPIDFLRSNVFKTIAKSGDGMILRKNLKILSTSIKRWPEYWSEKYVTKVELLMEVETVLGYIITPEPTREHFATLEDMLPATPFRYVGSEKQLRSFIDEYCLTWDTHDPLDITYEQYKNNWHLWTTSGVASGYKVRRRDNGKKIRINKSALPLVTTADIAFNQPSEPVSKVVLKAEVGKSRLVNSTDVATTLNEGYFVYKYSLERENMMFTSRNSLGKLQTSANILTSKRMLASSDIEKNDFIHSSYLDAYYLQRVLLPRLVSQEDVDLAYDLVSAVKINRVFVTFDLPQDFSKMVEQEDKGDGVLMSGPGGILSGRRLTTWINSINNSCINTLACIMVSKFGQTAYTNLFGGDDSIQQVSSLSSGILLFIIESAILLTINPLKSYISYDTAEFFRVFYKVNGYRAGYYTRVIHSIVSNNPVSKAEIDVITKLKAFWSNCQQIYRRCRSGMDYMWSLVVRLAAVSKVTESMLRIPVSQGGVGISDSNNYSMLRVVPGIPRFKNYYKPSDYDLDLSWYATIMKTYNRYDLDGIEQSYLEDMMSGIIDIDARSKAKKAYKSAIWHWKSKVTVIADKLPEVRFPLDGIGLGSPGIKESPQEYDRYVKQWRSVVSSYFSVTGEYREYVDILSRAKFKRYSQKLRFLVEKGIASISPAFLNTKSAYVSQSIMLGSPVLLGGHQSLPPDVNYGVSAYIGCVTAPLTVRSAKHYDALCCASFSALAGNIAYLLAWAMNW